ncbi:MAG TPA: radical SAM protein [Aggregatilineales bacterium]|nr:radical SAM protein [Anaerolineales bacterium]HRE46770.1 radical SAM protein [Aggregatilineales bacterium]
MIHTISPAVRATTDGTPDILLVNPLIVVTDPVEERLMTPYFPLGLLYLAAVLRENAYSVAMYDGAFQPNYASFEAAMIRLKPKVVGITALITTRRNALALAEIAKKHGAFVIFGGPDPTGKPDAYLKHKNADGGRIVDLIVWDEGENTLIEVMNHLTGRNGADLLSLQQIKGLRYLADDESLISTPRRPPIDDLDSLPFPARDLIDVDAYRVNWSARHGYWSLSLINTRGCPYACTWCQKGIFGRSYRSRSAANVAEEMRLIKDHYKPDQVRVVDDITGVDREWVFEWRDEVAKRDAAIPFECLSRVNLVDVPMLTALKDIGCQKIYFGAESGSQKVLNAMKKGSKVEQIYRAAEACRQVGIHVYYFMMVGYPGEDMDDLYQSVKLLTETVPDSFSTTIAYPLPGTEFYQQVRDRIMHDGDDWAFTAENRLLFQRGKYNTEFYRWVQRWFNKEWEVARARSGRAPVSGLRYLRSLMGLHLSRGMVRLIARLPGGTTIEFTPAPGR